MKFKHKPHPKHGDIRYKVFFAWLPITIGLETRWLERASVKQKYLNAHTLRALPFSSYWLNLSFEQQPLPDYKSTSWQKKYLNKVISDIEIGGSIRILTISEANIIVDRFKLKVNPSELIGKILVRCKEDEYYWK